MRHAPDGALLFDYVVATQTCARGKQHRRKHTHVCAHEVSVELVKSEEGRWTLSTPFADCDTTLLCTVL